MVEGSPLDLLSELVSIPSHVSQPEGIRAVGDRLGAELATLGFERADARLPERSAPAWAEELLSPGVGFDDLLDPVVWRRSGAGGGELLLLGDLDAALATDPADCRLILAGKRAVGPAVADMKGGLVVMVEVLRRLARSGRPSPPITIVLSADEQAGSLRSAATIRHYARSATWCICLECGRDGGRVMRSRGHIGIGRLTATGVEAHAGSARESGVNAVTLLARGVAALDGDGVSGSHSTVTPTIVSGGSRRSLVPALARAVLDVRARDEREWEGLESRMRAALAAVNSGDRLHLELFNHRPGLPATDRTTSFLALITDLGQRLRVEIEATDSLAAGSSAFVDSTRVSVLDGMGPAGGALMTTGEYIEIASIDSRADLIAATIDALMNYT